MIRKSCIAILYDNGVIKYIECDGDYKLNKDNLINHYSDLYKSEKLIYLGNVLYLNESCSSSIFYCRDRKANYNQVKLKELNLNKESIDILLDKFDYLFLFNNNQWSCLSSLDSNENK